MKANARRSSQTTAGSDMTKSHKKSQSRNRRPHGPPSVSKAANDELCTLDAVGVSPLEERLYEVLLLHPGLTLTDLTGLVGVSRRKLQLVLEALETKGMTTHSPERCRRYFPTPPDVAIESLIAKRADALRRVRLAASRLQQKAQDAKASRDPRELVVEIITGREAQREVFEQIQRAAQRELICFDRPPHVIAAVNEIEFDAMARRVSCRAIYDRSVLELPGAAEHLQAYISAGEEARVFHTVPLKLIGADRRIAMLPLELQRLDGAALLVRPSSLLDSLYELFEVTWERATPVAFATSGEEKIMEAASSAVGNLEQLISLLAAGLNDKTIASQLGISHRTLDRHMRVVMKGLDARTRFQAGWQAAHRGLPI